MRVALSEYNVDYKTAGSAFFFWRNMAECNEHFAS